MILKDLILILRTRPDYNADLRGLDELMNSHPDMTMAQAQASFAEIIRSSISSQHQRLKALITKMDAGEVITKATIDAISANPKLQKTKKKPGPKSSFSTAQEQFLTLGVKPGKSTRKGKAARDALGSPGRAYLYRVQKGYLPMMDTSSQIYSKDTYRVDTALGRDFPFGKVFLMQKQGGMYVLVYATVLPALADFPSRGIIEEEYTDLDKALEAYNAVPAVSGHHPRVFETPISVMKLAEKVASEGCRSPSSILPQHQTLAFLLSFAYAKDPPDTDDPTEFLREIENVCSQLNNPAWPKLTTKLIADREAWILPLIRALAFNQKKQDGSFVTVNYFERKIWHLMRAFDIGMTYLGETYPEVCFNLKNDISNLATRYISAPATSKRFPPSNRYEPLTIGDVDVLLDKAFAISSTLYNGLILQLSTCLRNIDKQLVNKTHLLETSLDFSAAPKNGGPRLAEKTAKKLAKAGKTLANPSTSIVTRVILKHMKFVFQKKPINPWESKDNGKEREFWKYGGVIRNELSDPEDGHQRSLRTTGATFLRFGLSSLVCPFQRNEIHIANRMGHINTMQITTRYAATLPADLHFDENGNSSLTPDEYFNFGGIVYTMKDGSKRDITANEFLFDAWLLRNFINRYSKIGNWNEIEEWIIAELPKPKEDRIIATSVMPSKWPSS